MYFMYVYLLAAFFITYTLLKCLMFNCFFGQGIVHSRTHTEEDELKCEFKMA